MIKGNMGGMCRHTGKNRSKAKSQKIIRKRQLRSKQEYLLAIRSMLFNEDGSEKNLLQAFEALCKYNKDNVSLNIQFFTGKSVSREDVKALRQIKQTYLPKNVRISESDYTNEAARLLIAYDEKKEIVGYVYFEISVQGDIVGEMMGSPCIIVYDICCCLSQKEDASEAKPMKDNGDMKETEASLPKYNVMKHLVQLCELIARKYKLSSILVAMDKEMKAEVTQEMKTCLFDDKAKQLRNYRENNEVLVNLIDPSNLRMDAESLDQLPFVYYFKTF